MWWKLLKWSRQLRIWLSGNKREDPKYRLFKLEEPVDLEQIYGKLIKLGYQYNYAAVTYTGQLFQVRRLTDIEYQIHLRIIEDSEGNVWLTGHYELQPEADAFAHSKGEGCRTLTEEEISPLRQALTERRN